MLLMLLYLLLLFSGRDVPVHDGDVDSLGAPSGAVPPHDPVGLRGQLRSLRVAAAHELHL